MFFPVSSWFAAFALTVAVELPIAALMLRRAEPEPIRRLALVLLANLATHPFVWYVLTQLLLVGTIAYTAVAEGWAFTAEAVFYLVAIRGVSARRAAAASLAANTTSFLAGRVIGALAPALFR